MTDANITRRELLTGVAGGLAGLVLTSSCTALSAGQTKKTAKSGFKLAVCDWTIGKRTDPASLQLAKKIGLDGVQVDFGSGQESLPLFDAGLQQRLLQEAKKQNIEIASLAMGVLNEVPYKSDPRAERWVAQAVDTCKAMGTKVILLAFFSKGDLRDDKQGIDAVVTRLKDVAPKAETAGVTLGVESWLNAEQHIEIIERVGSPAVKVYYDVANSHKMGYDIYKEIRRLGKLICEFHAKDYSGLYGMGSIDFKRVRQAMDAVEYRGWLVMEGTQMPLGVEESCRYDTRYLRTLFPRKT